jgi:hypothetical protein
MRNDHDAREGEARPPFPDDDDTRTEQARRVAEDYADGLRETFGQFRKWLNEIGLGSRSPSRPPGSADS